MPGVMRLRTKLYTITLQVAVADRDTALQIGKEIELLQEKLFREMFVGISRLQWKGIKSMQIKDHKSGKVALDKTWP